MNIGTTSAWVEIDTVEFFKGYTHSVTGDLRPKLGGFDDNYEATREVKRELSDDLLDRIEFDPEHSYFVAYTVDRETADTLAAVILAVMERHVPLQPTTDAHYDALSDAVHDVASEIASETNNAGGQVEYLLSVGLSAEEISRIIREA